jgi:tetratricopeptide (TPR) repeat protein
MKTTPGQIDAWIQKPSEDEHLEFKQAKNQYDERQLLEYCVAIANEGGGHFLLGIHDPTPRKVVGTRAFLEIVKITERLFNKLRFRVNVEEVNHPGGRVVIFHIPSRPLGTAYHLDGRYLMRSGSSLVAMTEDQLRVIFAEVGGSKPYNSVWLTDRDVVPKLDALAAMQNTILNAVQAEKGVPLEVLRQILDVFGDSGAWLEAGEVEERLRAKADEYQALRQRLERLPSDEDADVQRQRREAGELISAGRFDAADAALAEAERIDLETTEELQARADRRRLSAAGSRAERAAAAALRLAYGEAAEHYEAAAAMVPPGSAKIRQGYVLQQASYLYAQGHEFGETSALHRAIVIYRSSPDMPRRDQEPGEWASTQNSLGLALIILGDRESGRARLEEAAAAFRAALEEWRLDRESLDWAMAQDNLGGALLSLGEREAGTTHLQEAVAAFRATLQVRTRELVPPFWAATQNNLGVALRKLGSRTRDTDLFRQAIGAFRSSLQVYTADKYPLHWAATQDNLGNALASLGALESGTLRLEKAVAAYKAALQKRTRERLPLEWAATQSNLGSALSALADRETGTAHLEEAVIAFRAALEESTRERAPVEWADTQHALGDALRMLGERENGKTHLEAAVAVLTAAVQEQTRDGDPLRWAAVQNSLGCAFLKLGEREPGTTHLKSAIDNFRAALEEWTRDRAPLGWAIAHNNLGEAFLILGEREGAVWRLEAAAAAYRSAREIAATAKHRKLRAEVEAGLVRAERLLAELQAGHVPNRREHPRASSP